MRADKIDDQIKVVQAQFKFKDGTKSISANKLKAVLISSYPSGSSSTLLEQGLAIRAAELLRSKYDSGKYLDGTVSVINDMRAAGSAPADAIVPTVLNTYGAGKLNPTYPSLEIAFGQLSFAYNTDSRANVAASYLQQVKRWKGATSMDFLIKQYKAIVFTPEDKVRFWANPQFSSVAAQFNTGGIGEGRKFVEQIVATHKALISVGGNNDSAQYRSNVAKAIAAFSYPVISVANASVQEGNAGTTNLVFNLSISRPWLASTAVTYKVRAGTARLKEDFTAPRTKSLTLAPYATNAQIIVPVVGELAPEPDETLFLDFSVKEFAQIQTTATGNILDDDTPSVSIADASVVEGNSGTKRLDFLLTLSHPAPSDLSLTCFTAAQSATVNEDYLDNTSPVAISKGQTSGIFSVVVNGDTLFETDETLLVRVETNAIQVKRGIATGKIVNDDILVLPTATPTPQPTATPTPQPTATPTPQPTATPTPQPTATPTPQPTATPTPQPTATPTPQPTATPTPQPTATPTPQPTATPTPQPTATPTPQPTATPTPQPTATPTPQPTATPTPQPTATPTPQPTATPTPQPTATPTPQPTATPTPQPTATPTPQPTATPTPQPTATPTPQPTATPTPQPTATPTPQPTATPTPQPTATPTPQPTATPTPQPTATPTPQPTATPTPQPTATPTPQPTATPTPQPTATPTPQPTATPTPQPTATPTPQPTATPTPTPALNGKIAFSAKRDGNMDIYVMNDDGSNETRLTTNPDLDSNPIFSPDGSRIVFLSKRNGANGVYTMNPDGTNQALLASGFSVIQPAFSPDGTKIVFMSYLTGNGDIYVMNADGTNPVQLTSSTSVESEPSFSPDGSKIIYSAAVNGLTTIYTMSVDGTNQVQLPNTAGGREPTFSPDGGKVSFVEYNGFNFGTTRVMNVDGTNKVEVSSGQVYDYTPAFSADGRKIVVSSYRNENRDIYIFGSDGANPIQLTERGGFDPVWAVGSVPMPNPPVIPSPAINGKIAYSATRNGNTDVYVIDANGTNETRLTTNAAVDSNPCFTSDGSKIVFQSTRDGNSEIYVMDFDGANQKRVTFTAANEGDPVFSPDASKIAFTSGQNLMMMDADGRNQTPITSGAYEPSFSPDGRQLVYSTFSRELYIVNVAERTSPKLIAASFTGTQPIFSLDGSRIIYVSSFDGISTMKVDGTDQRDLASVNYRHASPCLSPDGSRMAVQARQFGSDANSGDIYVMYADGTAQKRLTTQGGQYPSWAPIYMPPANPPAPVPAPVVSGRIAFDSARDDGVGEIYVMNADGTNQTRLTNSPRSDNRPLFSPDGSKIAFISNRDNTAEIYIMDADGANPTRLTNNTESEDSFSFSANGNKIVYHSISTKSDIYVMNSDGSGNTRLTTDGVSSNASFSPDGNRIVFLSRRDGNYRDIYIMNVNGSQQTRLTYSNNHNSYPKFSPDGSKIVFESYNGGDYGISIINSDGTPYKRLSVPGSEFPYFPTFSPDGSKIVFHRDFGNANSNLYCMNSDTSNVKQLTLGGRIGAFQKFSPDGSHVTFSANNSGAYEIYTVNTEGTHQVQRTILGGRNPSWTTGSVPAPSLNSASTVKLGTKSSINSS